MIVAGRFGPHSTEARIGLAQLVRRGPEIAMPTGAVHANAPAAGLRILTVLTSFGQWGGIEAFVEALGQGLRGVSAPDCSMVVAVRMISGNQPEPVLRERLEAACARVEWNASQPRVLWREIRAAQVVHLQNVPFLPAMMARLAGRPLLATIHNRWLPGPWSLRRSSWRIAARLCAERWYNSDFVRASWEDSPVRPGSRVVPTVSNLRLDPSPWEGRRGFLFISRLIDGKGAELLLRAYAQAGLNRPQWPLRMAGQGPLLPALQSLADELGLDRGMFTGFVTEEEKWRLIGQCKWLVAPPVVPEDFGLTPVESRGRSVPSIVSVGGGLPEAAGPEALFCQPGSCDDLARALNTAAAMPEEEYRQRAWRGYQSLSGQLVPWSFYAETYRRLVKHSRPPSISP